MPFTATIILAAALSQGPVYPQEWACVKACPEHPIALEVANSWLLVAPYDKLTHKLNIEIGVKFTFGGKRK